MRFSLRVLLIFMLLLLTVTAKAQQSLIAGKAPNYAGQTLKVFVYSDFLTLREKLIAKTKIDATGNFKVQVPINFTQFVFLKTDISRSSFYVEPSKNYFVSIPKLAPEEIPSLGVQGYAPIKISSADSMELNTLISKFEDYLDHFYKKNLALIARKAIKKEASIFKSALEKRFNHVSNKYFKSYIKYKLATLEAAGGSSKIHLYKNYFSSTIQYNSLEYMQFFSQTYTRYLKQLAGTTKGRAIEPAISSMKNYAAAMKGIQKADTLFSNDTLCELLLLKGLNEYYYQPKSNKRSIESLLSYIEKNGKGVENKKIAHNTLALLTLLSAGTKAPEFALPDAKGKLVRLSDFKGKYVYLDFWATWCIPCLQELKLKQVLNEKYGEDIVFVSISLDKNAEIMNSYLLKNKQLTSVFLYGGTSETLLDDYNIKAIPTYFLLDRDGDFIESPAKKPSENAELVFKSLLQKK